jgi:hypothetical protein
MFGALDFLLFDVFNETFGEILKVCRVKIRNGKEATAKDS